MFDDLKMFARYAFGLRHFLRESLTSEECRRMIAAQLGNRAQSFLLLMQKGVFANPRSPYRKLLSYAGVEFGDLVRCVEQDGIESTLEKLYAEGVYINYEEFKCRQPIERGTLRISLTPRDFDNPLLARSYQGKTGGSRGAGTRVAIDLDLLTYEAAHFDLFEGALGVHKRPIAVWRPVPPAVSGTRVVLKLAKLGWPVEQWYSQNRFKPTMSTAHYFLIAAATVYGSEFFGHPVPRPEYVPLDNVSVVARWLETQRHQGMPGTVFTQASSAVRVCRAALDESIDVSGSFFIVGDEPYTSAKARVIEQAGCRAATYYAMAEIGTVGEPCGGPKASDDMHLLEDKLAVIQKEKRVINSEYLVEALLYTTLLPSSPKIMLNTDTSDYGVLEKRDCNCPAGAFGLKTHLSGIRSYDKLTSEGVAFIGSDLIQLLEEVMPEKFGGYPTDYQFVEEEENGLPKLCLRVSPRIGPVGEQPMVDAVLEVLDAKPGANQMMADRWRQARAIQVVRGEPYATFAGKILPLHMVHAPRADKAEQK